MRDDDLYSLRSEQRFDGTAVLTCIDNPATGNGTAFSHRKPADYRYRKRHRASWRQKRSPRNHTPCFCHLHRVTEPSRICAI